MQPSRSSYDFFLESYNTLKYRQLFIVVSSLLCSSLYFQFKWHYWNLSRLKFSNSNLDEKNIRVSEGEKKVSSEIKRSPSVLPFASSHSTRRGGSIELSVSSFNPLACTLDIGFPIARLPLFTSTFCKVDLPPSVVAEDREKFESSRETRLEFQFY